MGRSLVIHPYDGEYIAPADRGNEGAAAYSLLLSALQWRGVWAPGSFSPGEVVRDGAYLATPNTVTSERPAPSPQGDPAWTLPDIPGWTAETSPATSISGFEFAAVSDLIELSGYRIWRPETSTDMTMDFYVHDVTDPNVPVQKRHATIATGPVGYVEIAIPPAMIAPGQALRLSLVVQKYSAGTQWGPFEWQYDGTGCNPDDNKYQRNGAHTQVCIAALDKNGIDRSLQLDQLKEGDKLYLIEKDDARRFDHYSVMGNTPVGSHYEIDVIRTDNGTAIRSGKDVNISADVRAGLLPAPYVRLPDYYLDNPPDANITVRGFHSETWPPTVFNNDAHGVDVFGNVLIGSADWDIMAISNV